MILLAGLGAGLPVVSAQATVHVAAKRVSAPGMTLHAVQATLDQQAAGALRVELHADGVDLPAAGWRGVGLDFAGSATRLGSSTWKLVGDLRLRGAPGGLLGHGQVRVRVDTEANNLQLNLAQGKTRVDAAMPLDQLSHAQLQLEKLPLAWLQGLVAQAWSGRLVGGDMDGTVAVDVGDGGWRASGEFRLRKAAFDSADGMLAGADLDVSGRATLDATGGQGLHSTADLDLDGGQLLLGSLYAVLPEHRVHLLLGMQAKAHGLAVRQLRFNDPGVMQLVGSMVLGSDGGLRNLHLTRIQARLQPAYAHYGKAWLASLGMPDLDVAGQLQGSLWVDSRGLRAFRFQARQVDMAGRRFAVHGLNGGLDWSRDGSGETRELGWDSLDFYRIRLGAAKSGWRSEDGLLALSSPLAVPLLGGRIRLQQLSWQPLASQGQRVQTALTIEDVDVARLCAALGWPRFSGSLSGAVPGLSYQGRSIVLDGGLRLGVFGGQVDVANLSLQHPFGDVPVLMGDIELKGLDLSRLTSVFDFGRITGTLDGTVQGLRMVGWKPVAFKGSLSTRGEGRISQRAVHNLTAMGGGGRATGLQGAVLSLFDSFGYARIGLHCELEGSVCHMGGIKPVQGGYLIVEGRGLPRLSVVGHQKDVSWPVLIARLQAAIKSGKPVVR